MNNLDKLIIQGILKHKNRAYGVEINEHLEATTGRAVSYAALYDSLEKLEELNLVTAEEGEATAERGWRKKLYFSVTDQGKKHMREVENDWTGSFAGAPA